MNMPQYYTIYSYIVIKSYIHLSGVRLSSCIVVALFNVLCEDNARNSHLSGNTTNLVKDHHTVNTERKDSKELRTLHRP